MASTEGFEPATARLEGVCSIQLSYVDINAKNARGNMFFFEKFIKKDIQ